MGAFKYSNIIVDDVVQHLLGIPCAVLAGALMYHLRLMRTFNMGEDWTLTFVTAAVLAHFLLHLRVYSVIRERVSIESEVESVDEEYSQVEEHCILTYFNTNKIHCLRAKYIQGEKDAPEFYAEQEALVKRKTAGMKIN